MSLSISPQIGIHQQYARIGIDADLGQFQISQSPASLEISTTPAKHDYHTEGGKLTIDNSAWRDALGNGPHLEVMNRIYSKSQSIALQGIAKIVEDGNRMAAIHTKENAIAALAADSTKDIDFREYMYMGDAAYDNIDLNYEPARVIRDIQPAQVHINVTRNAPEIQYNRGKLDIYMQQHASVEFTPPQIDYKI
ncbi:DUF6470 family protein [Paenibacillus caseinilyticus]|uniref:Uncharacterized protein n=1 Tax=Paenibacillus mucilaginosus K02 TaxID=997761 RepID=I0BA25_9BACL|nr:DUF6470 family protein [Paenibacillus mucilaginosus]AFH59222.1 hypothetical protein B2K_00495 [Paenibacillus mucilaginosus K02]